MKKFTLYALTLLPLFAGCSVEQSPQPVAPENSQPTTVNSHVPKSQPQSNVYTNPKLQGNLIDICIGQTASTTEGSDCSDEANRTVANSFCNVSGHSKAINFRVLKRDWSNKSMLSKLLKNGEWTTAEGGFIFTQITCE